MKRVYFSVSFFVFLFMNHSVVLAGGPCQADPSSVIVDENSSAGAYITCEPTLNPNGTPVGQTESCDILWSSSDPTVADVDFPQSTLTTRINVGGQDFGGTSIFIMGKSGGSATLSGNWECCLPTKVGWPCSYYGIITTGSLSIPVTVNGTTPPPPPPADPVRDSSANCRTCGTDAEPINTFNGELFNLFPPDFELSGPMPILFQRYYGSYLRRSHVVGDLGNNWLHTYDRKLNWNGSKIFYINNRGRSTSFNLVAGNWQQMDNLDTRYQLIVNTGQDVRLFDPTEQLTFTFDYTTSNTVAGRLKKIEDGKGNVHTLTYNVTNGQLQAVSDGLGQSLSFTYNSASVPKIQAVNDHTGRTVTFAYNDVNDSENLTNVVDKGLKSTVYTYENTSQTGDFGLMLNRTRPKGNVPYSQTYYKVPNSASGRVKTQADGDGKITSLTYNTTTNVTTLTDPAGNQRVHTSQSTGAFREFADQTGNSFSMVSDNAGRRTGITDRLGDISTYSYHPQSGKLASIGNPDGTTRSFSYAQRVLDGITYYDLTLITYEDGATESFSYDSLGNLTSHTDQAGFVRRFDLHTGNGQPTKITNAAGGIENRLYNQDATLSQSIDVSGNKTTFSYDNLKRLVSIAHADNTSNQMTYDSADNLTTVVNENNETLTYGYDANNNRVSVKNNLGNVSTFTYDNNDRPLTAKSALGGVSRLSYDGLGHVQTMQDANGYATTFGYDSVGRLVSTTDPAGNIWQTSYDLEGIPLSYSDPLGNTTSLVSDAMGRIIQATSPRGNSIKTSYDPMGRISKVTDPLGNILSYSYDARGLITGITLADGSKTSYSYNALGQITRITDPKGNFWDTVYDNAGRQVSTKDPLGNIRSITYNNRNRPSKITYPGNDTQNIDYDGVGQVTSRTWSDGTGFTYTFDGAGRLLSTTGATFSYDKDDRIVDSNGISMVYDAGGRMTSMQLAIGKKITYAYDANDQLTSVTDWLGGKTTFTYDAAGRQTGMLRINGIQTSWAYDKDSQLVNITEGALANISITRNAKGQPTSAIRNVPLAATSSTTSGVINSYNAASQISTSGYSYDALGRLVADGSTTYAWNLASQLISRKVAGKTTSYTYDAFGNMLTRSTGGATTSYVWNLAQGIPGVVIERTGNVDSRYYVLSPGGSLLYSINAANGARWQYHYDEKGNTLFVTGDNGAIIASYAYSPFGRLLDATGNIENRHTWQGQFGIMAEGDKFYYIRARYYDAETGRFISKDSLHGKAPKLVNPYQYGLQNPMEYVDVDGGKPEKVDLVRELQKQGYIKGKITRSRKAPQFTANYGPKGATGFSLPVGAGSAFNGSGSKREAIKKHAPYDNRLFIDMDQLRAAQEAAKISANAQFALLQFTGSQLQLTAEALRWRVIAIQARKIAQAWKDIMSAEVYLVELQQKRAELNRLLRKRDEIRKKLTDESTNGILHYDIIDAIEERYGESKWDTKNDSIQMLSTGLSYLEERIYSLDIELGNVDSVVDGLQGIVVLP